MSESTNVAVTRRWFEEVWNQRNDALVHELMDPEGIGHLEGLDTRGPQAFLEARGMLIKAFPDFHITVEDLIAQGEQVAVRWSVEGTHRGDLLHLKATHKPIAIRGITWIKFKNGKLYEGWDCWNQGKLFAELQG